MNQAPRPLTPAERDRRNNRRAIGGVGAVLAVGTVVVVAAVAGLRGGEQPKDTSGPDLGEPKPSATATLTPGPSPTSSPTPEKSATASATPTSSETTIIRSPQPDAGDQNRELRWSVVKRYDSCSILGFTVSGNTVNLDMDYARDPQSTADRDSHSKNSPGLSWTNPSIEAVVVKAKGGLSDTVSRTHGKDDFDQRNIAVEVPSKPKDGTQVAIFAETTATSPLDHGHNRTTDEQLCGTIEYDKGSAHWDLATEVPKGVEEFYTDDQKIS